jgi:hypothetical protein
VYELDEPNNLPVDIGPIDLTNATISAGTINYNHLSAIKPTPSTSVQNTITYAPVPVSAVSPAVLNLLDFHTKEWAYSLNPTDVSLILQAVYRVPSIMHSIKSLSHSNTDCNSTERNSQSAAEIGKHGEMTFAKICRALPENYQVVNTAKQGKTGDFIIYYTDGRIKKSCLVDIKKYTSTVPKKELDKFHEDLTYGCYDAGLIISYNSKFSGIHDNIYIEQKDLSNGPIPIMYLSCIPDDFIVHAIKIIMMKTITSVDKEISSTKLESMLSFINSALSQSSMTRRVLSELNASVSGSVQKCQEQLTTLEIQIKRTVKEMSSMIEAAVAVNLPKVPDVKVPARDDNLDSKSIDVSTLPELPPYVPVTSVVSVNSVANTVYIPNMKSAPKPASLTMDNMGKSMSNKSQELNPSDFCTKDQYFIGQLSMFPWDKITDKVLENDIITIKLEPLKTKTRVYLLEHIETETEKLVSLFKESKGELIAGISQELIDAIENTFNIDVNGEDDDIENNIESIKDLTNITNVNDIKDVNLM